MKRLILAAALFTALAAADLDAQPMMAGPPPHGDGVPSAEMLATIPDLTPAQQADVRRILIQRRDAADASESKLHAEFEALHKRAREEHERIDSQTSDQLRKALGEDGFKRYAEWRLAHGPGMGGPHGGHDGPDGHDMHHGAPPMPGAPRDGGAGKPDAE